MAEDSERLRELVAEVAAAYFSNSPVSANDIPNVVRQIAESLSSVGGAAPAAAAAASEEPERSKLTGGQIRKSITPDALISFEDNKPYKTLRRHLASRGLSPEQYREKWGLPKDYPLVAPNYSAARSNLAKSMGLGQGGRRAKAPAAPKPAKPAKAAKPAAADGAPKRRAGRPKKVKA